MNEQKPHSQRINAAIRGLGLAGLDLEDSQMRAGAYILCIEEALGWYERVIYQGHTLKKKEDGWLLVVKARKGDRAVVAFFEGGDPEECIRGLA
ncbi:MAG: hypothetical protein KAJ07_13135, partial [Planctomycetes bacterium]|nr:hypothetical protein [Planctomycetota bacterium]